MGQQHYTGIPKSSKPKPKPTPTLMSTAIKDLLLLTIGSLAAGYVAKVVQWLFTAISKLATDERVYTETKGRLAMDRVLEVLERRHVFAERREVVFGRMVPFGVVIGRSFIAVLSLKEMNYMTCKEVAVRVLRPRWLPPLTPDDGVTEKVPEGVVSVVRNASASVANTDWRVYNELACPKAVKPRVEAVARALAGRIAATCAQVQGRVLISGPPGCGKTTATRLLALSMGARLVPGFDPTRPGNSVLGLLSNIAAERVVLVIEEVDVCLRSLSSGGGGGGVAGAAGVLPQVWDKATWNGMLDQIQFMPKVAALVMTSNLTFAELDAIDAEHGHALLRVGRITERIRAEPELLGKGASCKMGNGKMGNAGPKATRSHEGVRRD